MVTANKETRHPNGKALTAGQEFDPWVGRLPQSIVPLTQSSKEKMKRAKSGKKWPLPTYRILHKKITP